MIKYKTLAHNRDYIDVNIDKRTLDVNKLKIPTKDFTMIKKKLEEGHLQDKGFDNMQKRIAFLENELLNLN